MQAHHLRTRTRPKLGVQQHSGGAEGNHEGSCILVKYEKKGGNFCFLVTDILRGNFFYFPLTKSELVRRAFDELDSTSEKITFLISPQKPFFRLSCVGQTSSDEV